MRICLSGPRIRWRVTLFLAMLPFASTFANTGEVPKFNQFPAAIYTGPLGKLDLSSADAYSYRTRLREASRQPVNFGGHYQVATLNCSTGALIDAVTGHVTFLPSVSTTDGMESVIDESLRAIEFRANSRLMVLSGQINEAGIKGWHFYTFDGGTLRHIYTTAYVAPEAAQTNDSRETPPIIPDKHWDPHLAEPAPIPQDSARANRKHINTHIIASYFIAKDECHISVLPEIESDVAIRLREWDADAETIGTTGAKLLDLAMTAELSAFKKHPQAEQDRICLGTRQAGLYQTSYLQDRLAAKVNHRPIVSHSHTPRFRLPLLRLVLSRHRWGHGS